MAEDAHIDREVFDSVADAIVVIDERGRVEAFNRSASEMFGYARDEVVGRNVSMLMPEPDHSRHDGYLVRYLATGIRQIIDQGRDVEGQRKDGTRFPLWLRIGELRGVDGHRRFVGSLRDISARKDMEDKLRLSEARYRYAQQAASLGHWMWLPGPDGKSAGGTSEYADEAAAIFGVTPAELAISNAEFIERFVHADDRAFAARLFAEVNEGRRQSYSGRYRIVRPNGEVRTVREIGEHALDGEGRIRYALGVIQDITDQVEAEEFLMQAKDQAEAASRIKGDFLATMSHELRTPLNAVIGFADAILHGIAGPVLDKQREYLTDIGSAGRHLLDVINDVLDLSKIEAGRLEVRDSTVEPRALLDRCMSLVRHQADGKRLRLVVDVAPDLPMLRADELALKKVLINLLSNAVKFTPDGGRVALSARLAEDGGFVMAVTDTGIGMRAQDIPVVLLPFRRLDDTYSRRHEGTGLGLPLAKSLIELHGGRIEIESSPGVGTTVRIHVPRERVLGSTATSAVAAGDPATWQADAI